MADEIIRMEDIYADDIVGNINEVREARGTFESLDARLDNIDGNAPSPSTSAPAMDGTASPGSADTYSRGDHVHPTDTSRQAVIDSSHKLSSDLVDDTNNTNKFATAAQLQQIRTNENNILYNQLMGVKNMAKLYGTSGTNNNVTYTYNSDNTITVKSDSATHSQSSKRVATFTAPYAGKFLINGIPVGASNTTFFLNITGEGGINRNITGDDEVNPSSAGYVYNIDIYVRANVEVDTTFSIMFRPESISDSTYQPYAPSNRELYEMILALQ